MPKILVIEDDPALQRGLKDSFSDEGYEVLVASDGEKGLDLALSASPDLVLLDIMLPKCNGYEICKVIRLEGYEYPIVMLTAKEEESDIVRGLDLGADDYVTKPFNIRELSARVRSFLRRHRASDVTIFRFGNCELNRESRQFQKEGEPVSLTSKEYQLLEYFLENVGKALTRTNILNQVWGSSIVVTERSVNRCIATLRSKIEDDSSVPKHIKTIRDVGYRFELK